MLFRILYFRDLYCQFGYLDIPHQFWHVTTVPNNNIQCNFFTVILPKYIREIAEISTRCRHDVRVSESRRDCGDISYILPRLARSHRDCRDLAMMFVGFLNLSEIAARFSTSGRSRLPRSRRDCRNLAMMFESR